MGDWGIVGWLLYGVGLYVCLVAADRMLPRPGGRA